MSRKTRPCLFYDTTTSVCSQCLHPVEAKIVSKDDKVYMDKWCGAHGSERVLVSDDVAYYRLCREAFVKHPEMPQQFNTKMEYGCPYDCGLCPDHMQYSYLSVVETTDNCNLNCPVCYAECGTHRERHRPLEEIVRMLDAVVANEGEADVMQLSGGEPTLHPQFWEILDAAGARPIKHSVTLSQWYGQGDKAVEIATGTAVWYSKSLPTVPLRWVLVRGPQCKLEPQAFLCTDENAEPEQILAWFIRRWQIEVTFEEARAHPGMETQRQWSHRAIACTTPVILALYSIVALTARQFVQQQSLMARHAAWYAKDSPTFTDTIALVRRSIWSEGIDGGSANGYDMIKIPRA